MAREKTLKRKKKPACTLTLVILILAWSCGPNKKTPSTRYSSQATKTATGKGTTPPMGRSPRHTAGTSGLDALAEPITTISWNEPIRLASFKIPANPRLEGKTLREIVESITPGRDDFKLCSECHHATEAAGTYGLEVPKNGTLDLTDPWETVGTEVIRSWAGTNGWADQFAKNSTKPASLRILMRAWGKGSFDIDEE